MADQLVRDLRLAQASLVTWLRFGLRRARPRCSTRPKSNRLCSSRPARLLPNDVRVTVEQQLPGNLSMEDWQVMREIIASVRQAIPDAANRPAGEVLEYVRARLTD